MKLNHSIANTSKQYVADDIRRFGKAHVMEFRIGVTAVDSLIN